jgi:hypothetical protein
VAHTSSAPHLRAGERFFFECVAGVGGRLGDCMDSDVGGVEA